jgi:hypothetical protein
MTTNAQNEAITNFVIQSIGRRAEAATEAIFHRLLQRKSTIYIS